MRCGAKKLPCACASPSTQAFTMRASLRIRATCCANPSLAGALCEGGMEGGGGGGGTGDGGRGEGGMREGHSADQAARGGPQVHSLRRTSCRVQEANKPCGNQWRRFRRLGDPRVSRRERCS